MNNRNFTQFCLFSAGLFLSTIAGAQHSNEFYNDGALVHIQAGAEVHVWGDVHNYQATGDLQNNGLLKVQGNMYSDDLFRQQGTGTTRIENSDVNVGERQFISGSYAVRSVGSTAKGTAADGSFYDLELVNDQGMVYLVNTVGGAFDKYVADVRNSVHYNLHPTQMNRVITSDIGMTGAITYPANGSAYPAMFGMMNPTSPLGGAEGWRQNTVQMSGNMSGVDWGYVQGKMRQQVDATTGRQYPFVVGVEPGGAGMQMGMQYSRIDFAAGADYDVLEAYYERALPNAFTPAAECNNYLIDYFGGSDHGQWVFDNPAGGSTLYEMWVWPQDDNYPANSVWMITKDNGISGTPDECGPTPVGLKRGGFSGFSTFDVAGATILLESEIVELTATPINNKFIKVDWTTSKEVAVDHFEIERSTDDANFSAITTHPATGNSSIPRSYFINDLAVLANINYYYRIKIVNVDGTVDYTHSVVASLSREGNTETINIFPNPISDGEATIEITSLTENNTTIVVYDAIGQIVCHRQVAVKKGLNTYTLDTQDWPSAVYYVQVSNSQSSTVKELIKSE